MALASPFDWAVLDAHPRRTRPRRLPAWLVLAGLVVAFVAAAAAAHALEQHPVASDGLPERITVHGRHYDHGGTLTAAQVAAEPQPWASLGDVGPHRAPVFVTGVGAMPRGMTPTVILVRTAPDTYVVYSLVGGP